MVLAGSLYVLQAVVQGKKGAVLRGADGGPRPEWTYAKAAVGYETFPGFKGQRYCVFGIWTFYPLLLKNIFCICLSAV